MKAIRQFLATAALATTFGVAFLGLSAGTASADSVNWEAIAQCESGGNWGINTGNGHYGGLQFSPATWTSNGGVGNPAHASRADQIRVAENVLAKQGIGAWPTCGKKGGTPIASIGTGTTTMPATTAVSTNNGWAVDDEGHAWYPGKNLLKVVSGFLNSMPKA